MTQPQLIDMDQYDEEAREANRRLEADRVTAHWNSSDPRPMSDLTETPLFGGKKQAGLFGEDTSK